MVDENPEEVKRLLEMLTEKEKIIEQQRMEMAWNKILTDGQTAEIERLMRTIEKLNERLSEYDRQ